MARSHPASRRSPAAASWFLALLLGALLPTAVQAESARPRIGVRSASAPPELLVSFEEAAVVVAGATEGSDVAFYSIAREPRGAYQSVVRRSGLAYADAQGEARFDVESGPEGGGVPLKSVWAVVDLATGAYAVAAPEGFDLRPVPLPGQAFQVGAPGVVNRLRHEYPSVDLLVVRPGVGAWSLRSVDQGPTDHDPADDDRVLTSLEDLESLDGLGTPPPERYGRDDVVIFIEPGELRYAATRLLGPPPSPDGEEDGETASEDGAGDGP